MKNELLLIIGIPKAGKSWLASAIRAEYASKKEPVTVAEIDSLGEREIANIKEEHEHFGHVIVVCSLVNHQQLMALAPDRVYNIAARGNR